jgi:hypothetical protein
LFYEIYFISDVFFSLKLLKIAIKKILLHLGWKL